MMHKIEWIDYVSLNSKQQEIHNFQIVAGKLAEYGFECIKLADDWNGADFLALHFEHKNTLKVQLKGRRVDVGQKYIGQDIYMAFPIRKNGSCSWYLVPHDELLDIVEKKVSFKKGTIPWSSGRYSIPKPSNKVLDALEEYKL